MNGISKYLAPLKPYLPTREQLPQLAILYITYLITAQVSVELFTTSAIIAPAAGIGLIGLVLGGLRLWPAIFAASFSVYLFNGLIWYFALLLPVFHTIQPLVGAYALRRLKFDAQLTRLRDTLAIIAVAFVTAAIEPTLGYGILYISQAFFGSAMPLISWGVWWIGLVTSLLVLAPFGIRWLSAPVHARRSQLVELLAAFSLLVAILVAASWFSVGQIAGVSMVYILLVPLFWIALRLGMAFMTLALVLMATITAIGIFYAGGGDQAQTLGQRVYSTQLLINILAIIFLVLAALEEERKSVFRKLNEQVSKLESALEKISAQDQAKSNFIAVLAHELRNPLAPIVTSLEETNSACIASTLTFAKSLCAQCNQ
jgi:integral membrane sensor domain MASE1